MEVCYLFNNFLWLQNRRIFSSKCLDLRKIQKSNSSELVDKAFSIYRTRTCPMQIKFLKNLNYQKIHQRLKTPRSQLRLRPSMNESHSFATVLSFFARHQNSFESKFDIAIGQNLVAGLVYRVTQVKQSCCTQRCLFK